MRGRTSPGHIPSSRCRGMTPIARCAGSRSCCPPRASGSTRVVPEPLRSGTRVVNHERSRGTRTSPTKVPRVGLPRRGIWKRAFSMAFMCMRPWGASGRIDSACTTCMATCGSYVGTGSPSTALPLRPVDGLRNAPGVRVRVSRGGCYRSAAVVASSASRNGGPTVVHLRLPGAASLQGRHGMTSPRERPRVLTRGRLTPRPGRIGGADRAGRRTRSLGDGGRRPAD